MFEVACAQFTGSKASQQHKEYSNVTDTTLAAGRLDGVGIVDCDTQITELVYRIP